MAIMFTRDDAGQSYQAYRKYIRIISGSGLGRREKICESPALFTFAHQDHTGMKAPIAPKKPFEITTHQHTRTDHYHWLNQKESPEVHEYLGQENAWTDHVLEPIREFRETLFNEMKGRIRQDDASVPYRYRGYYYYVKYETGKEYPIHCRKQGNLGATEEIILDVNLLAEGQAYCDVKGLSVSPDNQLLAYGVDWVSRRNYTLFIKNLVTGEILSDKVENTEGSYAWAADNRTIFYDIKDEETLRPFCVKKHRLGENAGDDTIIYIEEDETFYCNVSGSKSEEYIFITSSSTLTSELRYIRAGEPDSEWKVMQPRIRGLEYEADHFKDHFYIKTNLDAKNFKLVKTPVTQTGKEHWQDVIAHRPHILLESFDIFKDYLVLEERDNSRALTQIRIIRWDGSADYYLEFGEPAYSVYGSVNAEFDTEYFRYGYTSMITPSSTFDFHMGTREKTLLKQQEVVGGYDASQYTSERILVKARDGEEVPLTLVYKKSTPKNAGTPLLLYGYGSYGITLDPYFSSVRLSLLDRGFIYAIAHIRGGQDKGYEWYEKGKLLQKKNTFSDFIDCAEYLVQQQYTSPAHLYAMGGSAGGLLMGAVINLRPDLFNGIIAAVPFVDVVTTMLDESIPLTTGEFDEWGNPKDEEYYQYILSYSPYDNVEAKNYPNILVTTGLHDSQVQYWEPAKWVAKLRELKTDDHILIFHCEMEAGHGGKSGRFEALKEVAMEYGFLLMLEGKVK